MRRRAGPSALLGSYEPMAEFHLFTTFKRKSTTSSPGTSALPYSTGYIFLFDTSLYHLCRATGHQWRTAWRRHHTQTFTYSNTRFKWTLRPGYRWACCAFIGTAPPITAASATTYHIANSLCSFSKHYFLHNANRR